MPNTNFTASFVLPFRVGHAILHAHTHTHTHTRVRINLTDEILSLKSILDFPVHYSNASMSASHKN